MANKKPPKPVVKDPYDMALQNVKVVYGEMRHMGREERVRLGLEIAHIQALLAIHNQLKKLAGD